jgi:murein DD-endopeptidase MepM/ murein hydrolase activator NlpD
MHAGRGSTRQFVFEGGRLALLMSGAMLLAALAGALLYRGLGGGILPAAHAGLAPGDPQAAYTEDDLRRHLALLAEKVGTLQARLAGVDALGQRLAMAAGVSGAADAGAPSLAPAAPGALPLRPAAAGAGGAGAAYVQPAAPVVGAAVAADAPTLQPAVSAQPAAPVAGAALAAGPAILAEADPATDIAAPGPAQMLGRDIDMLAEELAGRLATMQVLDMALTRQRADLARLPTSMPVSDYPYLSSSYGWRRHPVSGRHSRHDGLDFAAPRGTPILAAAGGVVVAAGWDTGYGRRVEIDHGDGLMSRYAHASEILVQPGDLVERGQPVARVGSSGVSTGPHLHFEVRLGGQALDPRLFLGRQATAPPTVASTAAPLIR